MTGRSKPYRPLRRGPDYSPASVIPGDDCFRRLPVLSRSDQPGRVVSAALRNTLTVTADARGLKLKMRTVLLLTSREMGPPQKGRTDPQSVQILISGAPLRRHSHSFDERVENDHAKASSALDSQRCWSCGCSGVGSGNGSGATDRYHRRAAAKWV